jgi:hypothetical protein
MWQLQERVVVANFTLGTTLYLLGVYSFVSLSEREPKSVIMDGRNNL